VEVDLAVAFWRGVGVIVDIDVVVVAVIVVVVVMRRKRAEEGTCSCDGAFLQGSTIHWTM
jgi:hypothetical protein